MIEQQRGTIINILSQAGIIALDDHCCLQYFQEWSKRAYQVHNVRVGETQSIKLNRIEERLLSFVNANHAKSQFL